MALTTLIFVVGDEGQAILNWISKKDSAAELQDKLNNRYQQGTGGWFFDTPGYNNWEDGLANTLWCKGQRR